MEKIIILLVSYLIGAIPFGFIVAKLVKKIDIRKYGSGNIGATNVARVIERKWGICVFFLDFLKGAAPFYLVKIFIETPQNIFFIFIAIFVVCGHNWPIFLGFKGGKGVSTSLGALSGLVLFIQYLWIPIVSAVLIWVFVFFVFRIVSAASLLSGIIFALVSLFMPLPVEIKVLSGVLIVFIILRHRENIKRLLIKKERQF